MKYFDEIPTEILELIGNKSFGELSRGELTSVNKLLPEEDYNKIYLADRQLKEFFKNDNPPSIKGNPEALLIEKFRKKHKKPGLIRILQMPVPVWQVAAGIALIIGINFLKGTASKPVNDPGIITLVDTVYLAIQDTVEVIKRDTVYIEKENKDTVSATVQRNPAYRGRDQQENLFLLPFSLPDLRFFR